MATMDLQPRRDWQCPPAWPLLRMERFTSVRPSAVASARLRRTALSPRSRGAQTAEDVLTLWAAAEMVGLQQTRFSRLRKVSLWDRTAASISRIVSQAGFARSIQMA